MRRGTIVWIVEVLEKHKGDRPKVGLGCHRVVQLAINANST